MMLIHIFAFEYFSKTLAVKLEDIYAWIAAFTLNLFGQHFSKSCLEASARLAEMNLGFQQCQEDREYLSPLFKEFDVFTEPLPDLIMPNDLSEVVESR